MSREDTYKPYWVRTNIDPNKNPRTYDLFFFSSLGFIFLINALFLIFFVYLTNGFY